MSRREEAAAAREWPSSGGPLPRVRVETKRSRFRTSCREGLLSTPAHAEGVGGGCQGGGTQQGLRSGHCWPGQAPHTAGPGAGEQEGEPAGCWKQRVQEQSRRGQGSSKDRQLGASQALAEEAPSPPQKVVLWLLMMYSTVLAAQGGFACSSSISSHLREQEQEQEMASFAAGSAGGDDGAVAAASSRNKRVRFAEATMPRLRLSGPVGA